MLRDVENFKVEILTIRLLFRAYKEIILKKKSILDVLIIFIIH